jgi:hypothetical protein
VKTIKEIRDFVRKKYAWPGGYPMFLIMADGGTICMACARKEWASIAHSTRYPQYLDKQWQCAGVEINWEDTSIYCDHCSQLIESAYGEEE